MKRLPHLLALLAGLFLSGPAWAQQKMTFTPQWTPQAQFAGYYVALELGFYEDAGIDLEIVHPNATESAITRLRNNSSQITTLQLCQAMETIDNGVPLVNILQTSMNNGLVIVSRKDENPIKQKGIRVGTWSVGFDQIALAMSLKEGLDYDWIRFASSINLFIAGAIDATLAMSYNEYYLIKQSGFQITENNVYRFCDHNYNVQEDGVYMLRDCYNKNKDAALGTWDELVFKGESLPDIRGWQILLYTDGLNEAENPQYELFGNDHLISIMADTHKLDAKGVILMLQEAVEKHRDGAAPNDDLTLLSLQLVKE